MSMDKLLRTRPAAFVIWFFLAIGHLVAITTFTRAFLLTRPVFTDVANSTTLYPQFEKAVVLVVDALRHDFMVPSSRNDYYLNNMPFSELGGSTFMFLADPPTTTLQRLKGLTTGSLPTFIDAGSNFAGTNIEEDNWLLQAVRAGKRIAMVGDDTWDALFGHIMNETHPFESLNVRDLDTVDNGVKNIMPKLVSNPENDIVIGHMLGVDHVGHRHGPNHPQMKKKMHETFEFIQDLTDLIDDKTILMVFGDHGMDHTGNHGGDSKDELEAGFWAFAKSQDFAQGGEVQQIDLVPTISALLGLPIPFNNLGFPMRELFPKNYDAVTHETARQISTYAEKFDYPLFSEDESPREYQQKLLTIFRDSWATFDLNNMYKAIALLGLSVWAIFALYTKVSAQNLTMISWRMSIGSLVGSIVAIPLVLMGNTSDLLAVALDCGFGLSLGALLAVSIPSISKPCWQTLFALVVLILHCLALFSNSYVVWESKVSLFLSSTIIFGLGARCVGLGNVEQYIGLPCALFVLALDKITSLITVCREEQQGCITTFYEKDSSSTGYWALMIVSGLIVGWTLILQRHYAIGNNLLGVASILLQGGMPLSMVLITMYWSMDMAEVRGFVAPHYFETVKIILARATLGIAFLGAPYFWYKGEVCVGIDFRGKKPRMLGYQNIYGAYALLPIVFLSWSLLIVSKPPAIVSLCALVLAIFNSLDVLDLTVSKNSLLPQVLFSLLGYLYFFGTGHQCTLVSIQWDSAFNATKNLRYPLSAVTVFLNTVGPFLLVSVAAVLVPLWRRPMFNDPRQILTLALKAVIATMGVAAAHTLSVMAAATILRRHLMAWKIFAPRFIYGGIILGVADIGVLIGLFVASHSISKVTKMFAK